MHKFRLLLFTLFGAVLVACTSTSAPKPTQPPPPPDPNAPSGTTAVATSDTSGVTVITSATVIPPTRSPIALEDFGLAPDFTNEVWLNTDEPLTLEKLKGKVVLVEFWTYS